MLDYCDLLQILSRVQGKKLKDVEVYGYITRELPSEPNYLSGTKLVQGGFLVEMRIFGVKFGLPDPVQEFYGDGNPKQTYFCGGYLSTCISDRSMIGDWYATKGNLSVPRGTSDVVNLFRFRRGNSGWVISNSFLTDIDVNEWDLQGRMYKYLMQSAESNKFFHPQEVLDLRGCKAEESEKNEPVEFKVIEYKQPEEQVEEVPVLKPVEQPAQVFEEPVHSDSETISSTERVLSKEDTKGTRFVLEAKSDAYSFMNNQLSTAFSARKSYLDKIAEKYALQEEPSSHIVYMFDQILKFWSNKPSSYGHTGKSLVKDYMDKSGVAIAEKYLGSTIGKFLLGLEGNIFQFALGKESLDATKKALTAGKALFSDAEVLYAGILSRIAGIDTKKMMDLATRCNRLGFSFSNLVNTNTYLVLLVSTEFRFQEVEELALCLGLANDKSIERSRNIGILFDFTLNSSTGSTIYSRQSLYTEKLGVNLTSRRFDDVKRSGTYIIKSRQIDLVAYVNGDFTIDDWSYPKTGWDRAKSGFNQVLPLSKTALDSALKDFTSTGLGVNTVINKQSWICNSRLLEKELFIYNKLYDLSQRKIPFDLGEINSTILEFEEMKGFKLEERQRDAVRLTGYGCAVVTGPAGSGKTTVSEAMVYALKKQKPNIRIQYAAPTGKAAKRLQEVVGGTVKTMHSMFGVNGNDNELFGVDGDDFKKGAPQPDVFFFDENAMVTVDLLFSVLSKIDRAQVFFLGDIAQLPPIGKGLPFKNMLSFLPYVALNVSKRSAEGSDITNNANIINEHSDNDNWLPLVNGDDCRLNECADENIIDEVYNLCAWHLGKSATKPKNAVDVKLNPDDIQVISPVATTKYSWSSTRLNEKLQDLFNPRVGSDYFIYGIGENKIAEYRIGDRIIHTNNNYEMAHYTTWKGGNFHRNGYQGIMNGDVGKIVGILPSKGCTFVEPEFEIPEEEKSNKEIRDDSAWNEANKFFIVAMYHNYEKDTDFYILYQVLLNAKVSTETEQVFSGFDLSNIQLAYALTIHKMQGSQGKLIIFAMGNMKNSGFLTRNMGYTGLTRGRDLVYLVGSVGNNPNSALSIARKKVATDGVVTVMDIIISHPKVA